MAAFGEKGVRVFPDEQFDYANRLYEQEKYDNARFEYERFVDLFQEDDRRAEALFQIGMTHFRQEDFEDSIKAFLRLIEADAGKVAGYSIDAPQTQACFMISEAYMKIDAPGQAINNLRNLILANDNTEVREEAVFRIGWYYLEEAQWPPAREIFARVGGKSREKYDVSAIQSALERVDEIPRKSPTLAGVFSVVPGGGFLYCERYRDALTAFLFNGLLMVGAWQAFENDNPALGAAVSFVGFGFYSGNFYGAVSSAHKYNQERERIFIDSVKQKARVNFSLAPAMDGVAVLFEYRF